MIVRTVAWIALVGAVAGCTAAAPISEPSPTPSTAPPGARPARTAIESELGCYLIRNESYSAGRGSTEQAAVAALRGWYPPITRTTRWDGSPSEVGASGGSAGTTATAGPAESAAPDWTGAAPTTWLLFARDGRGYGTATASQPDPAEAAWSASVDQLCVSALPPSPDEYVDLTPDGRTGGESLQDSQNAEFRRVMDEAILSLPEGQAADALRAVGWRVRVDERDGVPQFRAGTSSSWINLAIADGTVVGYSVG